MVVRPFPRMSYRPFLLAPASACAIASLALAHEGATGVVKERMDLMKGQAKQMKLIGEMAKGKKPFDAPKAAHAARDINISTKKIPELFPKGTDKPPSEALPEIWEDWDQFKGDADKAAKAAETLATTLEQTPSDGWKEAFKKLIDACKSCHQSFRAEEEDKGGGGGHHH
jgi:cytochrome c556